MSTCIIHGIGTNGMAPWNVAFDETVEDNPELRMRVQDLVGA
jgi:hypothetical protein